MTLAETIERLHSSTQGMRLIGLRELEPEAVELKEVMAPILGILDGDEPDTRYAAIQLLLRAALSGNRIDPALPLLERAFADPPDAFAAVGSDERGAGHWIGGRSGRRLFSPAPRPRDGAARPLALIAQGGWPGYRGLHSFRSAQTAAEIKPFLPFLKETMSAADTIFFVPAVPWTSRRGMAASALAHAYWLDQAWAALGDLLRDPRPGERVS